MGAEAKLIGFGPFKKEFLGMEFLPYSDEEYKELKEGSIILVEFCNCNTSEQSRWLAEACGTTLYDFPTHFIGKGDRIDFAELTSLLHEGGIAEWDEKQICNLDYLVKLGTFRFFLQPNR
jgi:hypothetical protein